MNVNFSPLSKSCFTGHRHLHNHQFNTYTDTSNRGESAILPRRLVTRRKLALLKSYSVAFKILSLVHSWRRKVILVLGKIYRYSLVYPCPGTFLIE